MSRRLRTRLAGVAIVSACGFTATNMNSAEDAGRDGSLADATPDVPIADAGPCAVVGFSECVGNGERLRECTAVNATPRETICDWKCADAPTPHCRKLQPAGGSVLPADLEPTAGLMPVVHPNLLGSTVRFFTDTGSITLNNVPIRSAGTGIRDGIGFQERNGVGVFQFQRLVINPTRITTTGANALALVSVTDMELRASIEAFGDCAANAPGPGGFRGGAATQKGSGSGGGGAGTGTNGSCTGGGGGGHGGAGGKGGNNTAGGIVFGDAMVTVLRGGGGGGGGGGTGGVGGGGGGAIHLVANSKVKLDSSPLSTNGINAGGCGGGGGAACGGGGGAGGTILIEAAIVEINDFRLTVNGGGGGGGSGGQDGERGNLSASRANGGNGNNNGGDGGGGGDNDSLIGLEGQNANRAGGGGGGVGRVRINTLSGAPNLGNVLFSPNLSSAAAPTTVTLGTATAQ